MTRERSRRKQCALLRGGTCSRFSSVKNYFWGKKVQIITIIITVIDLLMLYIFIINKQLNIPASNLINITTQV